VGALWLASSWVWCLALLPWLGLHSSYGVASASNRGNMTFPKLHLFPEQGQLRPPPTHLHDKLVNCRHPASLVGRSSLGSIRLGPLLAEILGVQIHPALAGTTDAVWQRISD
jgi:hypothetical protein